MKKNITLLIFFLFLPLNAFSELNITVGGPMTTSSYGDPAIDAEINTMMNSIIYDYSSGLNGFSVFILDSFNLANINAMPIGDNKLSNITLGFTVNFTGSVENPNNPFSTETASSAAPVPKIGFGFNAGAFLGISLGKRFDLIFSATYIHEKWIGQGLDALLGMFGQSLNGFTMSVLSLGTKLRYTLISKKIAESTGFAGLTVSPAFYFSYNPIEYKKTGLGISADYDTGIPVPPAPAGSDTGTFTLQDLTFKGSLYTIVIDLEILVYIKLLKVLNLYIGAGGSLSLSYLSIDAQIDCTNEVNSTTYDGYLKITGTEKGSVILPRVIAGFEINLFVRIGLQASISWTKGQALYGATFAIRFEL
jgi:hypothetical protein